MLNYQIENSAGTTGVLTPNDLTQQLIARGEQAKGVSPDGQYITLADVDGEFQVKTEDLLRDLGWKINGIEPPDPVEDFVRPEWRAAVANLGTDDQTKKLYLQEKLRDMGMKDANIVGQGTDFYVFHPQSNKYFALTNKRGLDMADVASGISQAPGFIGGGLGAAAGAIGGAGLGSVPLAMAGAAGGQALGDVVSRGALAAYDPTFRKIASQNLDQQLSDIAGNALVSGATAGLFKGAPMAIGALRGPTSKGPELIAGALRNGPIASGIRGLGAGAEEGGRLTATLARPFTQPGTLRDLATSQTPIAGSVQGLGLFAQLPGGLIRGGAKLYGKLGGKTGQEFLEGIEKNAAGDLSIPAILEKAGQTYAKKARLGPEGLAQYRAARKAGLEAEEALHTTRLARGADLGAKGRRYGQPFEEASNYGQKLDRAASNITGGLAQGTYGLGRGAQTVGAVVNRTAKAAAPFENRLYAKYGAEEAGLDQSFDDYLRRRKKGINSILANQDY